MHARTEPAGPYVVLPPDNRQAHDDRVVVAALAIIEKRLRRGGDVLDSPNKVKELLCLRVGALPHEAFGVMFLTSQHAMLECEEMFRGTLAQTSVYPREVVKRALELNAGAVILYHNHPSGHPEPSRADEALTVALRTALTLIDVRVLDHVVVSGIRTVSFAERGLL